MNVSEGPNSNFADLATWTNTTKKSARRIYQAQILLAMATVFLYVHSYKAIRLILLGETESILAMLGQGFLSIVVVSLILVALAPYIVGSYARKNTVRRYVDTLEICNRFVGTPLSATVSISVASFLMYGGFVGTILFFAGNQPFGLVDYTVLLAAIPLAVALAYPIGFLVVRGTRNDLDVLRAQA